MFCAVPSVNQETLVVSWLAQPYASLWFQENKNQHICLPICFVTMNCWFPLLEKFASSEGKEGVRQTMTPRRVQPSKNQGTLTSQDVPSRKPLSSGKLWNIFFFLVTALATSDNCVLNMCVSVYTSFPLESVMLQGGRGLVLGGLRLTPRGL